MNAAPLKKKKSGRPGLDITGRRFGRLTALYLSAQMSGNSYAWLCKCDCGKHIAARKCRLLSGKIISCGCAGKNNTKHGHARQIRASPTYKSWQNMLTRCRNKNILCAHRYSGKGITFDPRWAEFSAFLSDMGERPFGMTLDRIDSSGNYSKENCRWATHRQQGQNTSRQVLSLQKVREIRSRFLRGGETVAALAKNFSTSTANIYRVLKNKIWVEDAA